MAQVSWLDPQVLPLWIQAATMVATALLAGVGVWTAWRTWVGVKSRSQREHAAKVACWWEDGPSGSPPILILSNAADSPVYSVHMTVTRADRDESPKFVDQPVLAPGRAKLTLSDLGLGAMTASEGQVRISFTDAFGIRWFRDPFGILTRVPEFVTVLGDHRVRSVLSRHVDDILKREKTGLVLREEHFEHLFGAFVRDHGLETGADVLVGADDWVGYLDSIRSLSQVEPWKIHRSWETWALDAFTHGGRVLGLPVSVDTVALLRNTEFAPDPPTEFEHVLELLNTSDGNRRSIALRVGPRGDPFQIWPVFTGAGGALFHEGEYCGEDSIALDSEGSVAAWSRLGELGPAGLGVIDLAMGRNESIEAFAMGRAPFLVSTADVLRDLAARDAPPYEVCPVPAFRSHLDAPGAAIPFALVLGVMFAAQRVTPGVVKELFYRQLSSPEFTKELSAEISGPSPFVGTQESTHALTEFKRIAASASRMPKHRNMRRVWAALGSAEIRALAGEPAREVAAVAAREVRSAFADAHESLFRS